MNNEILLGKIKGKDGADFKIIDYFETPEALAAAITNPMPGDAYGVGASHPYDIYIYSASGEWVNNGPIQGPQGEKGDKGDTGERGPQGPKGEQGEKGPQGEQGIKGEDGKDGTDGTNAVITGVTASVDNTTGAPGVNVTMGGTETNRSFHFDFFGLKGESAETQSDIRYYEGSEDSSNLTNDSYAVIEDVKKCPALLIVTGLANRELSTHYTLLAPVGSDVAITIQSNDSNVGLVTNVVRGVSWDESEQAIQIQCNGHRMNLAGVTYRCVIIY